jgi:hypothetical protein
MVRDGADGGSDHISRGERVSRVEAEIEHDQRLREQVEEAREPAQDEKPVGFHLPGPHARILEPEKRTLLTDDGEEEPYLRFAVALPDDRYGELITEYPVPEPGPILELLYRFVGVDPMTGSPEDLFEKDVPVRPVEDVGEGRAWVLDLPPGIPPTSLDDTKPILERGLGRLPQGSDLLYYHRRRAEEVDLVTWEDEQLPTNRLYRRHKGVDRVNAILDDIKADPHIGRVLPTGPNLTAKARLMAYGVPIAGILGSLALPPGLVDVVRSGALVFVLAVVLASFVFTTFSVRRLA